MADEDSGLSVGWFIVGVAVGAAIGMLFAPQSGRETRDFITRKTGEGKEAMAATGKDLMERGREMYDRGRQLADDAAELFERGRRLVRGEPGAEQPSEPAGA